MDLRAFVASKLKSGDIKWAAKGAAGVVKAVARIDRPTDTTIAARAAVCGACEHAVLKAGVLKKCELCGCALWAKIRNAAEECPAGKWAAESKHPGAAESPQPGDEQGHPADDGDDPRDAPKP